MFFCNSIQGWKCICFDILSSFQMKCQEITNCLFRLCIDSLHSNKTSTFGTSFHSNKNSIFACCPTTSFVGMLTTNKSIIKFNQFLKAINTVTMGHCSTYLFQHTPSSQLGYLNMFRQSQSGNTSFVRSSQANRPKPFHKWYFRSMKQCVCCYRHLVSTMGALLTLSCHNETNFFKATCWTLKALWPPDIDKSFDTCFFGTKFLLLFQERNNWPFHRKTSLPLIAYFVLLTYNN